MSNPQSQSYTRLSPDISEFYVKSSPIVQNPDGTVTRHGHIPSIAADPDPSSSAPVPSKDVPLNPHHKTFVRIFLPRHQAPDAASAAAKKLPLIVYFHGGGFVLCSAANTVFHDFCAKLAIHVGVVVVSSEYRLAPEHRLPAAYDDALEALHRIRSSDDEWLRDFADISQCFLMGDSAGGNIAYHAGLRAAAVVDDLVPLKIKGLVLNQPYFGGSKRTPSELRLVDHQMLPLFLNDLMWELSLPIGADRDHEFCNHLTASDDGLYSAEQLKLLGWKVFVSGCDDDPLIDRQVELVKALEKKGVAVIGSFDEGGCHGVQIIDPFPRLKNFLETLKSFVKPPIIVLPVPVRLSLEK